MYLAVELRHLLSVLCFAGFGQQAVKTVDQLLLSLLLVFTLKQKPTITTVQEEHDRICR